MIVTVTANTALDVTYRVTELTLHTSHRVRSVHARAGGKGINVARVLHALDHRVLALATVGGATGGAVRRDLGAAGFATALTTVGGETRRTVTVVDRDATVFNEPGPTVTGAEWAALLRSYQDHLAAASAVVLSGSLPPGAPRDGYADLAARAAAAEVPAVLDAGGAALWHGCAGGPAIVAPNAAELAEATGCADPLTGARVLLRRGARAVVITRGEAGIAAVTGDGIWSACPPERVTGNPTGAGDAVTAALAEAVVAGRPWPERVARAVALSAAAVGTPSAGEIDTATLVRLEPRVRPELLPRETATLPQAPPDIPGHPRGTDDPGSSRCH
ncbi:hexose kinase [Haloechinothrix sp. LS1_15]|uniref:1-phosphofructokinase family hexose kinase n=1 Tax=Haloechinothrix sp. LS1_15 TaxID=2652248 RepID=UPI002945802E|nr:hexose kinase [Haloechinothrix sp. LS1_15]MDV6012128.1 hexose kinase [Haloechinothrix sp. LS1_15]